MNIIINQFAGLGDILFTIPIARYFIKQGHSVTYPTDFKGLEDHFPDITFKKKSEVKIDYDSKEFITKDDTLIIPMRWSDQVAKVKYRACMLSKYMIVNLPFGMWRTLTWKRNLEKEEILFSSVLKLKKNESYRLINDTYLSDGSGKRNIPTNQKIKNIKLEPKKGYTLLDWGLVLERATEIHTVNTAVVIPLEILNLKCEHPHIYIREPKEKDHHNYSYLCQKDYVFEGGQ